MGKADVVYIGTLKHGWLTQIRMQLWETRIKDKIALKSGILLPAKTTAAKHFIQLLPTYLRISIEFAPLWILNARFFLAQSIPASRFGPQIFMYNLHNAVFRPINNHTMSP